MSDQTPEVTLYDEVGGEAFFIRLVDAFYAGVADDLVLRPLYPEEDLAPAKRRLWTFLVQYWGGPMTYLEERGHPRLRMRHFPYTIGPRERDHWLMHMIRAVDQVAADRPDVHRRLLDYFVPAAEHLRNDTGLPISSSDPRRANEQR